MFFVERTPGGTLLERIKTIEHDLSKVSRRKVKVVEKSGMKLQDILTMSDPWGDAPCERQDCLMCQGGDRETSRCRTRNVVYTNTCLICKSKGTKVQYVGETSRSVYERLAEHTRDCLTQGEKSHMASHIQETHPTHLVSDCRSLAKVFKPEVLRKHNSALTRQLHEAVSIAGAEGVVLNS